MVSSRNLEWVTEVHPLDVLSEALQAISTQNQY